METMLYGSKGEGVAALQELLAAEGFYDGETHGRYDEPTREAVRRFQAANRIAPTGIANEQTQVILAMKSAIVK